MAMQRILDSTIIRLVSLIFYIFFILPKQAEETAKKYQPTLQVKKVTTGLETPVKLSLPRRERQMKF